MATPHYTADTSSAPSLAHTAVLQERHAFGSESSISGLSWSAILGGGCAGLALTSAFVFLGSTLGLSQLSVWGTDETWVSLGTKAIVFIIATQLISSAVGGYMAGRLRTKWANVHADEVFFRDTAHGFLSWGVSTLVMIFLVSMTSFATLTATNDTAQTVQNSTPVQQTLGSAPSVTPLDYDVDALVRTADTSLPTVHPEKRQTLSRLLIKQQAGIELVPVERVFLEQSVMAHTGVSATEATTRVNAVLADINSRTQIAKEQAEVARKTAQKTSLYLFLALLMGAFMASSAAALGGRHRDAV